MLLLVKVTKENISFLKNFDKSRTELNMLNKNFFEMYNKSNFTQKLIIKRKVLMIKDTNTNNYCGYIWYKNSRKNILTLNSLYLLNGYNTPDNYKNIINCIRRNYKISYLCQKEKDNFEILEKSGFQKKDGTYEMKLIMPKELVNPNMDNVTFETLKVGYHESLRCKMQNEIFYSRTRMPITKLDIYYDEKQDYYMPDGAVFLKLNNEYIGYGQIIIEMNTPVIVNFGIVQKYRSLGYGRVLLSHLISIIKDNGYNEVIIKVKSDNESAVNLYFSFGFKIIKEIYNFEIAN